MTSPPGPFRGVRIPDCSRSGARAVSQPDDSYHLNIREVLRNGNQDRGTLIQRPLDLPLGRHSCRCSKSGLVHRPLAVLAVAICQRMEGLRVSTVRLDQMGNAVNEAQVPEEIPGVPKPCLFFLLRAVRTPDWVACPCMDLARLEAPDRILMGLP